MDGVAHAATSSPDDVRRFWGRATGRTTDDWDQGPRLSFIGEPFGDRKTGLTSYQGVGMGSERQEGNVWAVTQRDGVDRTAVERKGGRMWGPPMEVNYRRAILERGWSDMGRGTSS